MSVFFRLLCTTCLLRWPAFPPRPYDTSFSHPPAASCHGFARTRLLRKTRLRSRNQEDDEVNGMIAELISDAAALSWNIRVCLLVSFASNQVTFFIPQFFILSGIVEIQGN